MADKKKAPKKLSPEAEAFKQRYREGVLREQERQYNEKYGALPGSRGMIDEYFARHPYQRELFGRVSGGLSTGLGMAPGSALSPLAAGFGALSANPQAAYDAAMGMLPSTGRPIQFGMTPQGPLSARQGLLPGDLGSSAVAAPTTGGETVVPKSPMKNRGASARDALRGVLLPAQATIHQRYGIESGDMDTVIGGFLDSDEGRKLGDKLLVNPGIAADVVKSYERYVNKWSGGSAAVDMPDPVVIDADKASPQELAAAVKGNKPVLVKNASNLGFDQDTALVWGSGTKVKPEKAAQSGKTPIVTKDEFVDVLRYIRGG